MGVQASNIQRELYGPNDKVLVYRLREPIDSALLSKVIDFARSEVGTRYSKSEAVRSVLPGPRPRTRQQFCSRLVARAYARAGIKLAKDPDYCTPDELRRSPLLVEILEMTELVSAEEQAAWAKRPNPVAAMQRSQNALLDFVRTLDPTVENFSDLDHVVQTHPEWDEQIAQAYRETGFLDLWRADFAIDPWHYDLQAMQAETKPENIKALREYAISTIREYHSGGVRYPINLRYYKAKLEENPGRTNKLLVDLYEQLTRNDEARRQVSLGWLRHHFPKDADIHLERIEPHSERWFGIVEKVEPRLAAIARMSIHRQKSVKVCSSCGDPAQDYMLMNSADFMPGVPSLRLCDECLGIRRGFGEKYEAQ